MYIKTHIGQKNNTLDQWDKQGGTVGKMEQHTAAEKSQTVLVKN